MTIIVLEGLDGSGKTTLGKQLAKTLGFNYRHYPVGIERAKLYFPESPLDLAMAIDMLTHPPNDLEGGWVLDRYYYSHYAYGGRFTDFLREVMPPPTYCFLLDVDPYDSYLRCQQRGDDTDITIEKRQDIRNLYHDLPYSKVIPGHLTPTEILNTILDITTFNP